MRCFFRAPGFSRNNLHVCQNLIFMSNLIHKVGFCLANVFFLKNVWLSLSTCNCRLTSLLNVRQKLRIVTWTPPDGRMCYWFQFRSVPFTFVGCLCVEGNTYITNLVELWFLVFQICQPCKVTNQDIRKKPLTLLWRRSLSY